jgi:hypothetical protein
VLDPASAAEQIRDYWAGTETEHAARRELVGYLVDRAAGFPDLTLRTEPAHQEAFVSQGKPGIWDNEAEAEVAIESLVAWASEQQRQPSGGVRMVLVFNPANQGAGPDCEFAVALR